jgi:undecaprenyl-diphosphatase
LETIFKAIILAIVEGATEFLPVSSTGHLILVENWLQLSDDKQFNAAFMVIIQLPAILSVVVYFRHTIFPGPKNEYSNEEVYHLWARVLLAVVPALILGYLFGDWIQERLFTPVTVACALFVGGILLIVLEKIMKKHRFESAIELPFRTVFFIGLFQCIAMVPGTSRSAATIIGAMLLGTSRPLAARFSFILAIPTMAAATGYTILTSGATIHSEQWGILAIGSLISFLVAYASVAGLMKYIQNHSFSAFGIYRVILAIIVFIALSSYVR